MHIDYIHIKTSQLLEEASVGGLSPPPWMLGADIRQVRKTR